MVTLLVMSSQHYIAMDKDYFKEVWNKYFKGQFSYKTLKEQFVPDEEAKKEIRELLNEIDSKSKEELIQSDSKRKKAYWKKHRFKVLIGIIIFHLLTFNKLIFGRGDTEITVMTIVFTVLLLYWVFTGSSTEPPDSPN